MTSFVTVHAPSKGVDSNVARGDSNTLCVRRAPLNSGFSRIAREKRLAFQAGLYCNEFLLHRVKDWNVQKSGIAIMRFE